MFGIGTGELLLILIIALIVLGPERMPQVARDVGRVINDLRRTSDELQRELLNPERPASAQEPAEPSVPATTSSEESPPISTDETRSSEAPDVPTTQAHAITETKEERDREKGA